MAWCYRGVCKAICRRGVSGGPEREEGDGRISEEGITRVPEVPVPKSDDEQKSSGRKPLPGASSAEDDDSWEKNSPGHDVQHELPPGCSLECLLGQWGGPTCNLNAGKK